MKRIITFATLIFLYISLVYGAKNLRIVCLTPNLCEITFYLGGGDMIVGVSDFCYFPPQCSKKQKIGGLLDPNIEKIVSLKANCAFLVPEERWVSKRLKIFGIRSYIFNDYTISDILSIINRIGKIIGRERKALSVIENFKEEISQLKREASRIKNKKRVLVVVGRSSGELKNIYIAGKNTFLDEIIQLAGGVNCYNGNLKYPQVGIEGICQMNPDVILELIPGKAMDKVGLKRRKREWNILSKNVKAVKNGEIYFSSETFFVVPGIRFLKAVKKLKEILLNKK